jgi:hypothetical protein
VNVSAANSPQTLLASRTGSLMTHLSTRAIAAPDIAAAQAAKNLRTERRATVTKHGQPLRDLYRTLELPGKHRLKELQFELDKAVASAYGITLRPNPLTLLMELNEALSAKELKGEDIIGPGLPKIDGVESDLVTEDCVRPPEIT